MRTLLAVFLALFAASAFAQSAARARPPGTAPLEEPPPPIVQADPGVEPEITVRTEDGQTVQEYRVKGKLYMMRVTPKHGRPYVMIDHRGDGQFVHAPGDLDSRIRVPQWVVKEF